MKNQFELAGGSVIGQNHLRVGKNNQDAYFWSVTDTSIVAVVCDGCGSGMHSEVGAKLGTRMLVDTIQNCLNEDCLNENWHLDDADLWQTIQNQLLNQLQQVAEQLGGDRIQTVQDYLLFTILGVVITSTTTAIFTLGDGVIAINDQRIGLGPFANNAPPYLAYGLLKQMTSDSFQLKALQVLPTECLQSVLIGTDGVSDLMQVAEQSLPGRSEIVGDIAQFWQDDRYFSNPYQIRRRLSLINRDVKTLDHHSQQYLRHSGLLPDDTTLIVIRKKEHLC